MCVKRHENVLFYEFGEREIGYEELMGWSLIFVLERLY